MMNFDIDRIIESLYQYCDNENKNGELARDLEYIIEKLNEKYYDGEVPRVINAFQDCSVNEFYEMEYNVENVKAIKKVKSPDIAFIAAHVGFIFGALYAENSRLHFCEE